MVKVDLFNADNGVMGDVTIAGSECPPCKVSVFTSLDIIALTLLVVGIVTNFEMERGKCTSSTADFTKPSEDDKVINTIRWEEAVTK